MTKAERTRQFIIEQSATLINKKGIAGTSMTDLMDVTKLAKGGIYGNFESKEEICLEVFNYLSSQVGRGLDNAIAGKRTAKEKLTALLDYYQHDLMESDMGGCPLLNFGNEADDTNPKLQSQVAKAIRSSQQRISKIIEEGKSSREMKKSTNADLFALKMFAMIEGAIFTARLTNRKEPMSSVVSILKAEIEAL